MQPTGSHPNDLGGRSTDDLERELEELDKQYKELQVKDDPLDNRPSAVEARRQMERLAQRSGEIIQELDRRQAGGS